MSPPPGYLSVRPQEWATIPSPTQAVVGTVIIVSNGIAVLDLELNTWTYPDGPTSPCFGLAGTAAHVWVAEQTGILWHSSDRGATWTEVSGPSGMSGATTRASLSYAGSMVYLTMINDGLGSGTWGLNLDGTGSWDQVNSNADDVYDADTEDDRLWWCLYDAGEPIYSYREPISIFGTPVDPFPGPDSSNTSVHLGIRAVRGDKTTAFAYSGQAGVGVSPRIFRLFDADPNASDPTSTEVTIAGVGTGVNADILEVVSNGTAVLALTHNDDPSSDTNHVYRSIDAGGTWTEVLSEADQVLYEVDQHGSRLVSFSQETPGLVIVAWYDVATTSDVVKISADSGVIWTMSSDVGEGIRGVLVL